MSKKIKFENLGTVNKNLVVIGDLAVWFSYQTPVAFKYKGVFMCRQNDWSRTTGKLLNELEPDKTARVDGALFENHLNNIVGALI